jgi:hypothetical protein
MSVRTACLSAGRNAGTTGIAAFGRCQDGSMSAGGAVEQFRFVFDLDF